MTREPFGQARRLRGVTTSNEPLAPPQATVVPVRRPRRPGFRTIPPPVAESVPVAEPVPVAECLVAVEHGGFEAFYAQHREPIARALALTLGDADLASEAVDEAMTRALVRWERFGSTDNRAGWVYRVALNWSMSFVRRRRRRNEIYAVSDSVGGARQGNTADPAERVGDPQLAAAVALLPVPLRAVVVCRIHLDMSIAETAAYLGVRPGTVKSRLSRALAALHTTLTSSPNPGARS